MPYAEKGGNSDAKEMLLVMS